MPAKSNLRLVTPTTVKRAVAPRRRPNSAFRTREHLTETEVEKLLGAARANRHGHRDATMLLVAFRHGLRASEVCDLRWEQLDFAAATLHVGRVKNGKPSTHPIRGDELRALRKLLREALKSPFVFVSERGGPFAIDLLQLAGQTGRTESRPAIPGARPHVASCRRLQARRRRPRHPINSGLFGPSQHSTHCPLHGAVADALQEFLAMKPNKP